MPRKKRSSLGRKTLSAKRTASYRAAETSDQRKARQEYHRKRVAAYRAAESLEHRKARLEDMRIRTAASRAAKSLEHRKARLEAMRIRAAASKTALRRLFQGQNAKKSLHSVDRNKEETESIPSVGESVLNPERDEKSVIYVSDLVYVVDKLGDNRLTVDISNTEEQCGIECEVNEIEDPLSGLEVEPKVETVVEEEEDSSLRDDYFVEVKEEIEVAPENIDLPF
ncbi:uncharacterized protein LOC135213132 isoform X4 [Macrobrachium nipponense]|uniref:uncharacterized protein LOC135213132 isoform X4 n=1 Tax=Macrobrachium nipponense TaxID=159736 RepID=UPI0030C84613